MQVVGASGHGQPVPPPAYTPSDPAPSYQATEKGGVPPDSVHQGKEADDDKAETYIAPVQVSGV